MDDRSKAAAPYPDFGQLRADARASVPRFVAPHRLAALATLTQTRGRDWCTAVLGRPFPGLRGISTVESQMLVLADERELTPALPDTVVAERERATQHARARQEADAALQRADQQRWAAALATCGVPVEVRANTRGRRYRTGVAAEALRHVVPLRDASSGPRGRAHRAGRALCETATRATPLQLAEPTDAPATCARCVDFTARLHPAG